MVFHAWAEQIHVLMTLGMFPRANAATWSYLNIGAGKMLMHFLDYSSLKGRGANLPIGFKNTEVFLYFLGKNASHLYLTRVRIGWHGAEGGM